MHRQKPNQGLNHEVYFKKYCFFSDNLSPSPSSSIKEVNSNMQIDNIIIDKVDYICYNSP